MSMASGSLSLPDDVRSLQERCDLLKAALDAEKAAHSTTAAERDEALRCIQAMEEQAQLDEEEIEAAIAEFERIAQEERSRADAAERALRQERLAFSRLALTEADAELERRTASAQPDTGVTASEAPLNIPAAASPEQKRAENAYAEESVRCIGEHLLEKRRARIAAAAKAAAALAHSSYQRESGKGGAQFGDLVSAAAAAAATPDLTLSEAVRSVQLSPLPSPPPRPSMGAARRLSLVGSNSGSPN